MQKQIGTALVAGGAQSLEASSIHRKVVGLIPGQRHIQAEGSIPGQGRVWEAMR